MIDFLHANHIIVCKDSDLALSLLLEQLSNDFHKVFDLDEFKLDDVKSLVKSVHLTSTKHRFFIIKTHKINSTAQNALLKMLEEDLSHTTIIFIAPSKSIFLPTMRSRLPIQYQKSPKQGLNTDFDFTNLSLESVFHYLAKNRFIDKQKAFDLLVLSFYFYIQHLYPKFKSYADLQIFSSSFKALHLNTSAFNIISNILYLLLERSQVK